MSKLYSEITYRYNEGRNEEEKERKKVKKVKIDDLDVKILKHLQQDARVSLRELGRKLNTPHTTVFTRVERLVLLGVIPKFSAILHPHELGLQMGIILVNAHPSHSKEIAMRLSEFEEVRKVFRTFDGKIIAEVVVSGGHGGFEDFLTKASTCYSYNISIRSYPIYEVVKFDNTISESGLEAIKSKSKNE